MNRDAGPGPFRLLVLSVAMFTAEERERRGEERRERGFYTLHGRIQIPPPSPEPRASSHTIGSKSMLMLYDREGHSEIREQEQIYVCVPSKFPC